MDVAGCHGGGSSSERGLAAPGAGGLAAVPVSCCFTVSRGTGVDCLQEVGEEGDESFGWK